MNNRKEVAKRLRFYADRFNLRDANPYWYVQKAVFGDIQVHVFSDMFNQLADLIDPTCEGIHRREPDDIDGTPRYTIHCSNCGQLLDETSGIPHSPMYCLNCGTRIIRGCLYSQSEDSSEVVQD